MNRKIAFVATVYRHLEAFHLPFIRLLQNKGYEIHAYARPDHGKDGVLKNNVICHDIPFQRSPFHWDNLKALKELTSSFRKEKFQLIHVHTPVAGILGRIAAKQAKIPYVMYTAHGFHFFNGAPLHYWLLYYPVERMMARWTDSLITINEEDFRRANKFNVRKDVHLVPGVGVETKQFVLNNEIEVRKHKRNELQLSEKDFVILCVAELNDNKNQKQLIEAVHVLSKKYNNIKCLIVGIGESHQFLQDMVNQLQLNKIVHFLSFRRDIPELLAASDVVTLLSKREGLPKALLEALAASKPIVATNIRGNRDLVADGVNGYLVPVSDVEATVKALTKLINDPLKIQQMGYKSKEIVKRYDLEEVLLQMEQIYNQALKFVENMGRNER